MPGSASDIRESARRLADEVLFPAAVETDAADVLPVENLDALARAGFYGLPGPADAGGLDADFETVCAVIETLAAACLTTTFVWVQHLGAVRAAAAGPQPVRAEWLGSLCRGTRRAGVALTGQVPGPARLLARPVEGGWRLTGAAPWVSGWGRIDLINTAARDGDENVVWSFVDARESASLAVERLELVAINSSATVTVHFTDHFVPAERVTGIVPPAAWQAPSPATLRVHAAMILGVAVRCASLMGPSPIDEQLVRCRTALDGAMTGEASDAMAIARAKASELALFAAARLMVSTGSRAVLRDQHAPRLAREALFLLVYGGRPAVKAALLEGLASGG